MCAFEFTECTWCKEICHFKLLNAELGHPLFENHKNISAIGSWIYSLQSNFSRIENATWVFICELEWTKEAKIVCKATQTETNLILSLDFDSLLWCFLVRTTQLGKLMEKKNDNHLVLRWFYSKWNILYDPRTPAQNIARIADCKVSQPKLQ